MTGHINAEKATVYRSAVVFLRGTIQNALRVRFAHNQRKDYFYFVVQESLRTFLNHFFTRGDINRELPNE